MLNQNMYLNKTLTWYFYFSHIYETTTHTEERCFIADFTSPDHCMNIDSNCTDDVLTFGNRIRNTLDIVAVFDGWFDPHPNSDVAIASGIYNARMLQCKD